MSGVRCMCPRCSPHWGAKPWRIGAVSVLFWYLTWIMIHAAFVELSKRPAPQSWDDLCTFWLGASLRVLPVGAIAFGTALNVWPHVAPQHYHKWSEYLPALPDDPADVGARTH